MSKHLKVINQTNTLLSKQVLFTCLELSHLEGQVQIQIAGAAFPTGMWWCRGRVNLRDSPIPPLRSGLVLNQGLFADTLTLFPHPCNGSSLATTQAREVTTCKVDCPDSEGLLEGPEGSRSWLETIWTQISGPWYSEGQSRVGKFFACGFIMWKGMWSEEEWGDPLKVQGSEWGTLA